MIIIWVLLFFYIILLIYRLIPLANVGWTQIVPTLQNTQCTNESDCNENEICFHGRCIPKYRGMSKCNPNTGKWELTKVDNQVFVKCICKYPHIIGQLWEGTNCDIELVCGPNGRLLNVTDNPMIYGKCICDRGYVADSNFTCRKLLPSERIKCNSDEIRVDRFKHFFHPDYNISARCIKKPCSYNVLNGLPLHYTQHDKDKGCICDPTHGNFGIKFNNEKFLNTEGYDACANIFIDEPDQEVDVNLYNYFYILDKDPIAFIKFNQIKTDEIIVQQLRPYLKNESIEIAEDWNYSYAQHVFKNENFDVRTRKCEMETIFQITRCYEHIIKNKQMINCQEIRKTLRPDVSDHANIYNLLYVYPVCFFLPTNPAHKKYHNRYVLNPFLLSFKEKPYLLRTNGFYMYKWFLNTWLVDFSETEFNKYEVGSNYPELHPDPLNIPKIYNNYPIPLP